MKQYPDGTPMKQFDGDHIPQVSQYNYNYYKGFGDDLICGVSDDDHTTEWYLVDNDALQFKKLGQSYGDQFETLDAERR